MKLKQTQKQIFGVGIGVLGLAVTAFADPDRCLNCGFCSAGDWACGMCIVEAVQSCCASYVPGAYGYCDGNHWYMFCNGPGGGMTEC